jgi:Fe-S-cluster containining protein
MRCIEIGCFECCKETEMQLSEEDVKRIEKLGYSRDEFSIEVDGVRVLKNVNGQCYFLKDGKCSIYDHRPKGCRFYPVIYDVERGKATVHDFCPLWKEVKLFTIKKVERELIRHIEKVFGVKLR